MSGIDWSKYLSYFTQIKTRQGPMSLEMRAQVEALLTEALGFDGLRNMVGWGTAGGFGNGTEVVVHLHVPPTCELLSSLADRFD